MSRLLRVVLDTNVIISALLSPGVPRTVMDLCRRQEVLLVLSDAILSELSEVLRRKFDWEANQVAMLLDELRSFAVVVVPAKAVHCIADDPADDRVLECALEAHADVIVSGDTRHLQPLGSFEGIPILSPGRFFAGVGDAGWGL